MLIVKPTSTKQRVKGTVIFHDVYIGNVLIGTIQANIFAKNEPPYLYTWVLGIGQPQNFFKCDSIDEAVEFATQAVREFISLILE